LLGKEEEEKNHNKGVDSCPKCLVKSLMYCKARENESLLILHLIENVKSRKKVKKCDIKRVLYKTGAISHGKGQSFPTMGNADFYLQLSV
jgi:hypothetical protein